MLNHVEGNPAAYTHDLAIKEAHAIATAVAGVGERTDDVFISAACDTVIDGLWLTTEDRKDWDAMRGFVIALPTPALHALARMALASAEKDAADPAELYAHRMLPDLRSGVEALFEY